MAQAKQLEIPLFDDTEEEDIPYKYSISSYGADFDVEGLVRRLKNDDIYIPSFQRENVWKPKQKSKFIESLLLGLPVPGIFLARELGTQKLIVIDGQQRLRSLLEFYGIDDTPGFELKGLESKFNNKTYEKLSSEDRRQLDNAIIHTTIVKQDEPDDGNSSIYLIFQRLNTGGTQLQPQEIRAALYHGDFNALLEALNKNPTWRKLYGSQSLRKKDQELILRFFAFYFFMDEYAKTMVEFLNRYMKSNRNFEKQPSALLTALFERTVDSVYSTLGEKALKPRGVLNVAAYDSIMVAIAKRLEKGPITSVEKARQSYKKLIGNEKYLKAIRIGTSDEETVKTRFAMAEDAFKKLP